MDEDIAPFGDLTGKIAAVTGSSSGIGRAIALELAAAGADLVIHARQNRSGAERTAADVSALGRHATTLLIDLADPSGQDELCDQAWKWRDGIDIWVNNAGADMLTGEPAGWPFEQKLERLWQVDVLGTIRISRAIGRRMGARMPPGGAIINVGWDQAEVGMSGDSGEMFAATKGAIMAFTRSLAKSLAPRVRVNCVAPGWIRTQWGNQASSYWQERACAESLLQRWGEPEDVARAVRYLASAASSFITGQILCVNGGFRMQANEEAN